MTSYTPIITSTNGVIPASSLANPIEGAVYAAVAQLLYTNQGTPLALFTIPSGAVIVDWVINVTTLFNDSGTDLVSIGVSGTQGAFALNVDVSSTGLKTTGVVLTQIGNAQSGAQAVTALYTGQNQNATTGAMYIIARYFLP